MTDAKRLNTVLGVLAAIILVISFSAFAYTLVPKGDPDLVTVNGLDYTWDTIFQDFEVHSFTANEEDFNGIHLEELVYDAGVSDPANHTYRLNGLDGYQRDVTWNDMVHGYLTVEDHRCVFPGLTQSFWVRDMASIEVI